MRIRLALFGAGLGWFLGAGSAFADSSWSVYGFLLPSVTLASSGLESFSQPNASAFTAAGNPVLRKNPSDSQLSWEVAQSRIGFKWMRSEGVEALAEFDFIDFTKSVPTTSALPRVRRILVQWKGASGWRFQAGQDWDLISPLGPFTLNPVGHYFQSGDLGFMRIQAMASKKSDDFESAWALGMPTQNALASPSGDGKVANGCLAGDLDTEPGGAARLLDTPGIDRAIGDGLPSDPGRSGDGVR